MKMNGDKLIDDTRQCKQEKLLIINGVLKDTHNLNRKITLTSMDNLRIEERLQRNDQHHFDLTKNSDSEKKIENINKHDINVPQYNSTNNNIYDDKKKLSSNSLLPEKVFQIRNSPLTDLFNEVKHMRTVYNIFVAILLILLVKTAVHDIFDKGSINLGLSTIIMGFRKISYVAQIWLSMVASSFTVYYAYRFWAQQRMKMSPKSYRIKIWDYGWLFTFIIYQMTFIVLPAQLVIQFQLPPPSSFIILMEEARLIMKIHAFVRSNAPYVLAYKPHTESKEFELPEFQKFSYFLFAPTLIYKNNYPRTKEIRWRYVVSHFFDVILVIFYVAFIFERFVFPIYKEFGHEPLILREFILNAFFNTAMPGIVVFLCGFYCLLHAWMNAFAELMRFGDRMFYKDWWNCGSYGAYYRTWNVVVHDWLYTYVYKDVYEIIMPGNRFIATFVVFFTSAVFHEYIMSCALRFFYPVMFTMFAIFGYFLIYIFRNNNSKMGNIFMWFSLCTGSGIMISFYTMEYFARVNCPAHPNYIIDLILPRSWYCFKFNISEQ